MIHSYVINLDQDAERLAFFAANFRRLGIAFERTPAIDGRAVCEADFQAFLACRPRHGKTWLRGQMGCFLSHYSIWERIARGQDRFCAVFEDDIHASDDLKAILSDDRWIPDEVDIIRLETSTNRLLMTAQPLLTHAGRPIFGVKSTSWCAGAYLINRRTARQLVDLSPRYHEPVDAMLYNFDESIIARTLNILQMNPAPCTQDKHLGEGNIKFSSNIEAPLSPTERVKSGARRISPGAVIRALLRSMRGYKRIGFH